MHICSYVFQPSPSVRQEHRVQMHEVQQAPRMLSAKLQGERRPAYILRMQCNMFLQGKLYLGHHQPRDGCSMAQPCGGRPVSPGCCRQRPAQSSRRPRSWARAGPPPPR